jgi:Holliday junction resolvase
MNRYQVGRDAEIRARKILESWGYTVIRSAGSKGPFDLVAFNDRIFFLVQVKSCQVGKIPSFEKVKRDLAKIPVPPNCEKHVWVWEKKTGFHYF